MTELSRNDLVPAWPLYQMEVVRSGDDPDVLAVVIRTRVHSEGGDRILQNAVRLPLTRRGREDRRAIDEAQREAYESLVVALPEETGDDE